MFDFIKFSSHHMDAKPWMITLYAVILIVVSSCLTTLLIYRLVRDTKKLKRMKRLNPKKVELTELLKVKDQIFGWTIGLAMFLFAFGIAFAPLVK